MAPVLAGMCKMESLLDGSLHLEDIALMNDAIMVRSDNELIAREFTNRGR
jgi:hypothetical protein